MFGERGTVVEKQREFVLWAASELALGTITPRDIKPMEGKVERYNIPITNDLTKKSFTRKLYERCLEEFYQFPVQWLEDTTVSGNSFEYIATPTYLDRVVRRINNCLSDYAHKMNNHISQI